MTGLDQLIVAAWFLPVVLFIVLPLCVTFAWGIISLLTSLFRQVAQRRDPLAVSETSAG